MRIFKPFLLLFAVMLVGCSPEKDIFEGKRVTHITIEYPDSSFQEVNIGYDTQNRLSFFEEKIKRPDEIVKTQICIDSVRYVNDTIFMFDNLNQQIQAYVCKDGYAINCYAESDIEGYYSASFRYTYGYLFGVNQVQALSVSNRPDTIYRMRYDESNNLTSYTDKYHNYTINTSTQKNKNNLLLPPIKLGVYAPAFYAGILGKQTNNLIEKATINGKEANYSYSETDFGIIIEIMDADSLKTVYKYTLK